MTGIWVTGILRRRLAESGGSPFEIKLIYENPINGIACVHYLRFDDGASGHKRRSTRDGHLEALRDEAACGEVDAL